MTSHSNFGEGHTTTQYYNQRAPTLPNIREGSHTKVWDTYGIVTYVGPHHQCYVKTKSGKVLKHNHRFILQRIPASIPHCERITRPASTKLPTVTYSTTPSTKIYTATEAHSATSGRPFVELTFVVPPTSFSLLHSEKLGGGM